jgi:hypothetical protein
VTVAPRIKTYILERSRDFFTGRSDKPCSGAARLEPTDSAAAPPRSPASTAALHSPDYSGVDLPTSAMAGGQSLAPASNEGNVGSGALDKQ